jgi:hypothetical protein
MPAIASLRSSAPEGRGHARQGTQRARRWRRDEGEAAGVMKIVTGARGETGKHMRGAPRGGHAGALSGQISDVAFFST